VLEVRDMPAAGYYHPRGAGNILYGRSGKRDKVTESGCFGGGGELAERDDVVFGSHDQQRRRRDLVIFVADWLLVDHLAGERRGTGPPRVVRAQGHPDQDVGQRLPDLQGRCPEPATTPTLCQSYACAFVVTTQAG
jgi:hypothetical protein